VALSCGTATTLAGVVHGLQSNDEANRQTPQVCGVAVLRAEGYLRSEAAKWLNLVNADRCSTGAEKDAAIRWDVDERYHFGGYAKRTAELDAFVSGLELLTGVPLEPVYTGKLFYALCDQIARGEYSPRSQIIALHTGGIIR
jgi:1-aminocyclopropane-1-carboxylate deaminase